MFIKNPIKNISILFCIILLVPHLLFSQPEKNLPYLQKARQNLSSDRTVMNVNNMSMWVYADGKSGNAPNGGAGVIYPRFTSHVVYQDGLIWGGLVSDGTEPTIRVGGSTYTTGTIPGRIIAPGVAEDTSDTQNVNRIWCIRRDAHNIGEYEVAELFGISSSEVTFEQVEEARERFRRDWLDWPVDKGAPFYDADGDGRYEPEVTPDGWFVPYPQADEPGLANADMVIFNVTNDLDAAKSASFAGSPPIGLEVQTTVWAYRIHGPLENIIFKHHKLIYKGTANTPSGARIDSMYVGQWSDPDIGAFADDLVGCDTLLNLGYAYNSTNSDGRFDAYNLPPPAVGYDISAGLLGEDASGSAISGIKRRNGFKNLDMISFLPYARLGGTEEPYTGYFRSLQHWNALRGFHDRRLNQSVHYIDPNGEPSKYVYSGDPVTGVGWIDTDPSDKRMILSCGPISMSPGDTNSILISFIGGIGTDRLSGITALKFYSRHAQQLVENLFDLPLPPPSPQLTATEYDGKILLNWGENADLVAQIEAFEQAGFKFEGYNIYQIDPEERFTQTYYKIATFDIQNNVAAIKQEEFDPESGLVIDKVVQTAENKGISRSMFVSENFLSDFSEPLINGRKYKFAISAYTYNHNMSAPVKYMESPKTEIEVTPHSLNPGMSLNTNSGDTLAVSRISGESDGMVYPIIIDPLKLTGDQYRVEFNETGSQVTWDLTNITKNQTVLPNMTNQSGDENYLITDGMQVVVSGPPQQGADVTWEGGRWISRTWPDREEDGELLFGSTYLGRTFQFGSSLKAAEFKNVHMEWFPKESYTDLNVNGQYDIGEPYKLIENGGYQKAFFYSSPGRGHYLGFLDVPFAVFDTEKEPPRQLNVLIHDYDGNLQWDLNKQYDPSDPDFVDFNNGDFRFNYVFIMNTEYDASGQFYDPTQGGFDAFANIADGKQPIQWVGWWGQRGLSEPMTEPFTLDLIAPNTNGIEDIFAFSSIAPAYDIGGAKQDVLAQVNVFPNPYNGIFNRSSERIVTFSHLPEKATIRILNLAGVLVRTLTKENESQFLKWDLLNEFGRAVGSGLYIAHIEMPELGVSKILKLVVVH